MSAGHTPGPWRYDYEDGYCGEIIAADGTNVAVFVDEPCKADSHLIASAPELLEALQDALAALAENVGMQDTYIDFDQVRAAKEKASAAIAKATGETT